MTNAGCSDNADAAALWVARMDREDWSAAAETELEEWLAGDRLRQGALLRAQSLWLALDRSGQAENEDTEPKVDRALNWKAWFGAGVGALAASLVALMTMPSSAENRYATGIGEIRKVPLADGSSASINSDTLVAMEVKPDARLVTLERGEAWFNVKKNPRLPFIVRAGQVRVQAVGTAFSVRNVKGGAEVLVTEGEVRAWSASDQVRSVTVKAGSRAFIASSARIVQQRSNAAELDRELAWREGKIDLVGEPLADAVSEFNRHNTRKIVLDGADVGRERIDGVFRTDDPEGFALAVRQLLGVDADLSSPKVIRLTQK